MGLYQIKHPCLVQPYLLKFILPLFLLFCDSCTLASQFCQGTLLIMLQEQCLCCILSLEWIPVPRPVLQISAQGSLLQGSFSRLNVCEASPSLCWNFKLWWSGLCVVIRFWQVTGETSLVVQRVKHLPTMQETRVQSPGQEDLLEQEMATHSSILARKIPWTEEPSGL